ncbi:MAG: precorrin-6A reductase [Nitrospinae bacterium]|nr:precorrin-6A reductase [Nitrospinota bacterium]
MILLLGGTSETRPIALALAEKGLDVLASTATDNELDVGNHPRIIRRSGRMNEEEMAELISSKDIRLLLDASHPYAAIVHQTAFNAAKNTGVPYFRFERPGLGKGIEKIIWAEGHEDAGSCAFSFGLPVLLTTGSRNLMPYVRLARERSIPIVARVLPHVESEEACVRAGLSGAEVIFARGPFSVEENLRVIKENKIGVVVTKDSGAAGGVEEKLEAVRIAGCRLVVVGRPSVPVSDVFTSVESVVESACALLLLPHGTM